MSGHLLSSIVFLPVLGALVILFIKDARAIRWVALVTLAVDFALAIPLMRGFDVSTHGMQFVERHEWIPSWNITYYLGVDGISVLFVFLTAFLGIICVLASWKAIEKKVKEFMIALLIMQAAMLGVFSALDMFLFYLFWEAMLIPMYLIIGVWGGPNRVYSAIKFFLYTLAGSILMLVGMIALYFAAGKTFDMLVLMEHKYTFTFQIWVFMAFFVAFAVKVPMFPFHTWLPDAHVEAPTAGSIILAGVLLKMGTYGFLRFCLTMFPDASRFFSTPIVVISIVAIIYGAFLALAQKDLKKLIAYSSISHMGFITMGIFLFNKNGIEGAILQMFNHGITTSALFLCIGLIYERTHTRHIGDYGWAASRVPVYATFLFIFTLASLGFPGTNGFIGEILIAFGAYEVYKPYLILLLIGIVGGAAYMLYMYKSMAFGADSHGHGGHGHGGSHDDSHGHKVWDVDFREAIALIALVVFVFWVGFHPEDFLGYMHESVGNLINQANTSKFEGLGL
ncbi:MAG: NADH-quinone oxidoreductase subunit M [Deltaproteobacteria bacterium]|nr:NADH-quinone oxidoreductase subunit M [Deltaproteobacteria bacterium]MCL4874645.1 NADH-quinone oxidoreductase subunit M [bacterium]